MSNLSSGCNYFKKYQNTKAVQSDPQKKYSSRPGFWKKSDGTEVHVKDMDDRYLENCIKLLDRKTNEKTVSFGKTFKAEKLYPVYKYLIEERERRNSSKNITNSIIYDDNDIIGIEPKKQKLKKLQVLTFKNL